MDRKMSFNKIWDFCKDKYIYTITFGIALLMMLGAWIIGEVGPFGGKCLVVVDGVHQYLRPITFVTAKWKQNS